MGYKGRKIRLNLQCEIKGYVTKNMEVKITIELSVHLFVLLFLILFYHYDSFLSISHLLYY